METARYISSSIAARAQLADEVESPLSSTPVFATDLLILSTIVIHGSRSLSLSRLSRSSISPHGTRKEPRPSVAAARCNCRVNIHPWDIELPGYLYWVEISSRVNLNKPRFPSKTGERRDLTGRGVSLLYGIEWVARLAVGLTINATDVSRGWIGLFHSSNKHGVDRSAAVEINLPGRLRQGRAGENGRVGDLIFAKRLCAPGWFTGWIIGPRRAASLVKSRKRCAGQV